MQQVKNLYHLFVAIVANWVYGFPSRKLTVIGVTGTDGKTTTSTLIYHILKTAGKKVALITSVAAYIGSDQIDTGFHVTTPNSWALQQLLRRIADKNYSFVVLEVTSHGLDQHRLWGINFEVGVLTNITHEHLDYHRTLANYILAKSKLLQHSRHAVLNADDSSFTPVKQLLSSRTPIHLYTITTFPSDFREAYNRSNASAAATAARILGIADGDITQAIKSFPGVKGRMEQIPNNLGITAIVDFAHTPNALSEALKALRATRHSPQAKIIAVYGCAGLRDYRKRPLMGDIGSKLADIVIFTAEDPRTEDVSDIIDQMTSNITGPARIIIEPDRQTAITQAVTLAKRGDIVAAFGKGHERSMCFGTIEYPWSDHDAFKQAFKQIPPQT